MRVSRSVNRYYTSSEKSWVPKIFEPRGPRSHCGNVLYPRCLQRINDQPRCGTRLWLLERFSRRQRSWRVTAGSGHQLEDCLLSSRLPLSTVKYFSQVHQMFTTCAVPEFPRTPRPLRQSLKRKWSLSCPHVSGCTRAVGLQSRVYSYSNSSLHTLWGEMVTLLKSTQTLCHHTEQGLSGLKVLLSVSYQQAV